MSLSYDRNNIIVFVLLPLLAFKPLLKIAGLPTIRHKIKSHGVARWEALGRRFFNITSPNMVCGTRVRTGRVRKDSQVFREEVYLSDLRQGLGLREGSSEEVPREPRPGRVRWSVVFCGPVNQRVVFQ